MSFVSDLFSGSKGAGFQAQNPNIAISANPVGEQQSAAAANNAIQQQLGLVNALNGQNGLQNQSNVFNQLQNVASGQGPNPAQAMLNQATGQNVANQAALMASQRGTGANPGLIARQAALQGANLQQQAIGQGATMQANQSLNALGQLGGLANQQVANQIGGVQGLNAVTQGQEGIYNQNLQAQNNALVSAQNSANQANAGIAQQNAKTQGGIAGGLINSVGGIAGGLAKGGMIPRYADGDIIAPPADKVAAPKIGPTSKIAQALQQNIDPQNSGLDESGFQMGQGIGDTAAAAGKGIASLFSSSPDSGGSETSALTTKGGPAMQMMAAKGGKVPAKVSPGEIYLTPGQVKKVAKGEMSPTQGQRILGKAKVKGDSYDNDTVDKTLEAGGIVIPRSKALGGDIHKKASEFVAAVLAHHRIKKGR